MTLEIEEMLDENLALLKEIKASVDRLTELVENSPEDGWGYK